ncbi:hypothetical protein U1Q18_014648 [Sarracenia purpurea var. burkii]
MPEGAESRKRREITGGVEASLPGQVRSSDFVEFSALSYEKDVEPQVRPFAGPKGVYHRDATGDSIDAHQVLVNLPEGVSAVPFEHLGGEGVEIPPPSPSGVVVAGGGGAGQVFDKRPKGGDAQYADRLSTAGTRVLNLEQAGDIGSTTDTIGKTLLGPQITKFQGTRTWANVVGNDK